MFNIKFTVIQSGCNVITTFLMEENCKCAHLPPMPFVALFTQHSCIVLGNILKQVDLDKLQGWVNKESEFTFFFKDIATYEFITTYPHYWMPEHIVFEVSIWSWQQCH